LSPDQIQNLFQPFKQGDNSTSRKFGGTGLGLAISRRLAQMLGGDIEVRSRAGYGSHFILRIPTGPLEDVEMVDNARESMARPDAPAAAEANEARLWGRILLAEDGVDNQRLVSFHLRRAGAEVTIAGDGQVACELARRARARGEGFDLILMDMQMPVLDGYGATAQLRAEGFTCPIVALTAHAMSGDREQCLRAGCDDYLTKPIDRQLLIDSVCRVLTAWKRDPASAAAA
jgi:CheY-like chemotaxis protein